MSLRAWFKKLFPERVFARKLEPAAERARENGALRAWVWFEMALGHVGREAAPSTST